MAFLPSKITTTIYTNRFKIGLSGYLSSRSWSTTSFYTLETLTLYLKKININSFDESLFIVIKLCFFEMTMNDSFHMQDHKKKFFKLKPYLYRDKFQIEPKLVFCLLMKLDFRSRFNANGEQQYKLIRLIWESFLCLLYIDQLSFLKKNGFLINQISTHIEKNLVKCPASFGLHQLIVTS